MRFVKINKKLVVFVTLLTLIGALVLLAVVNDSRADESVGIQGVSLVAVKTLGGVGVEVPTVLECYLIFCKLWKFRKRLVCAINKQCLEVGIVEVVFNEIASNKKKRLVW